MRQRIPAPPSSSAPPSAPSTTTRRLALVLAAAALAAATPYPRDALHDAGFSYLMPRGCAAYCGSDNQFCCAASQVCTTLAGNVATCVGAPGGAFGQYTTTWTETRTYTSTVMTQWAPVPVPTAGVDCVPQNSEQQACGAICCAGWQTCAFKGQCSVKPGYVEPSTIVVTSDGKVTTRYSAPFRVTGITTIVTTGTNPGQPAATATNTAATATSTSDGAAIGADGGTNGGGLSPGAIAGIVLGTLAGVALLLLLCFCCIARGLWNAIFGRNKDNERVETVYEEERYSSRHGSRVPSAYSRRERHGGWFGGGGGGGSGGRPSSAGDRREKKSSDGRWWLGVAGAAATLLALLNLKKDKKKPRKAMTSRYSDSYYTYSDATSPSSSSSGPRTNYSRRTDGSRAPSRATRSHYSRSSRRP
ncbi:Uncharacterized protein TCAP_05239 [Tolypocladium capitatum]|uniref:Glycophorin A domain-containing protein n=1 Tax=Tolypocladium capitatum TaxID=45235 RepID=A0A2K3QBF0_9HYPO|nr:Uncharacterized protein TCAP_05239 [Tolypocladium capitatum]